MTDQEAHSEIGRMYVEREDVERRLACTNNKLKRYKYALERTASAVEGLAEWSIEGDPGKPTLKIAGDQKMMAHREDAVLPSVEELSLTLKTKRSLEERLQELNTFFDERKKR